MPISFGPLIKKAAQDRGLTQKELAGQMALHEKTIADIYTRDTIQTHLLEAFSEVLQHDFASYFYHSPAFKSFHKDYTDLLKQITYLEQLVQDKSYIIELLREKLEQKNTSEKK